jgi:hypothetical protein
MSQRKTRKRNVIGEHHPQKEISMRINLTPKRWFWIVLLTLLAACAPSLPTPTETPFPTATSTPLPLTFTPAPEIKFGSATPLPTLLTIVPTPNPTQMAQQEEIKRVVQAYFEIHYRALSISPPKDFQQSGFGDLVSDVPEAKEFLKAEMSKLALETKYAELNGSRYVDYEFFLDFSNFNIDSAGQSATVLVVEDNAIVSENAVRGNPANPLVAQFSGLKHTITLHNEQGQWRIISDYYNDFLWRTMRQKEKTPEEMLNMLNTMHPPTEPVLTTTP